jgi:hypothetical protein
MNQFLQGSFVSDGLARVVDIQCGADYFKMTNVTAGESYEWYNGFAADTAWDLVNDSLVSSGGISAFASAEDAFGAEVSGASISQAAQAVVTMAGHPFIAGDIVRLYGTTGMRQIAGMLFQIVSVVAGVSFVIDLDTSGFAAAATAVKARKLLVPQLFSPRSRFITALTLGATTSVVTSVDHGYGLGEYITLAVPAAFGSSEINGLSGKVLSITSASEFVVEIDSAAASAFAFPTSGSVPFSFAFAVPAGDQVPLALGNTFPGSIRNDGIRGLALGSGVVGSAADEIYWIALKQ